MLWLSFIPVAVAITLSLITKNTVVSLSIACILGCFINGDGLFGFTNLIMEALGNESAIWTIMMVILFSVMVHFFEISGAIEGFTKIVEKKNIQRRGVQILAWLLGLFCFADSMSPLFVGSVMKNLSDKAKVSREKLSYIADSTASPLSVIHPFSSWTPYLAGLAVGIGCLGTTDQAYGFALKAICLNFYAIASVLLVFLLGSGIIKDFGPMKKAEDRARNTGKVLADNAVPLTTEANNAQCLFAKPRVMLNFVLPVIILVAICAVTVILYGEPSIVEAAMIVVIFMVIMFLAQGVSLAKINEAFLSGVKNAMPAVMVLAVAYPLNTLTQKMGLPDFMVSLTGNGLNPALLPAFIFIFSAVLSFATGTSWGTYAICIPIFMPLAFNLSGNSVTAFTLACFASIAGGGVFGDHCSPLSDTTILASMGSGSDHIAHVKTQLPYALSCALLSVIIYVFVGFVTV